MIDLDYCCIINIAGPSDHAHATAHMTPNGAASSVDQCGYKHDDLQTL